jgi:hypothetical protein
MKVSGPDLPDLLATNPEIRSVPTRRPVAAISSPARKPIPAVTTGPNSILPQMANQPRSVFYAAQFLRLLGGVQTGDLPWVATGGAWSTVL